MNVASDLTYFTLVVSLGISIRIGTTLYADCTMPRMSPRVPSIFREINRSEGEVHDNWISDYMRENLRLQARTTGSE